MKIKNAMQLKAAIKKVAQAKHISAQLVLQNYMLERLLERLSLSRYKSNFIIKGGFLISSIVGLDTRTTMDLDTTIKGFALTHEKIQSVFNEICGIEIDDDISFEITRISDIRETDDYPGIRLSLKAKYPPINVPMMVDITTGDMITPCEVEREFSLMFEKRQISALTYNLETVLAEKLETVLSRTIANTRARDYYDIYVLYALRNDKMDKMMLKQALLRTMEKRNSEKVLDDYQEIMENIKKSEALFNLWEGYRKHFDYAKEISFSDTCATIQTIMSEIIS